MIRREDGTGPATAVPRKSSAAVKKQIDVLNNGAAPYAAATTPDAELMRCTLPQCHSMTVIDSLSPDLGFIYPLKSLHLYHIIVSY